MKKWMGVLAVLMVASAVFAAEGWLTDFEKAEAQAKATDKYMLMDFSGSDWCGMCIKLDKDVFSKDAFKKFASENLVLMLVDFPRSKQQADEVKAQNRKLAGQYEIQYFPTVILLSPEGKVLWRKVGIPDGGAEGFVGKIEDAIKADASE